MSFDTESVFDWWVKQTIRKESRILSKLKSLYHKTNLKLSLDIPRSVQHAHRIDAANGNHFGGTPLRKK